MRRIALVTAAVAVCAVTAVAASARSSAIPLKHAGQLTVGFDLPATGFWNGTASGTTIKHPSGFEYSISQAVAKLLGIKKVVYLRSPFGGLFSPAPKKFDFALEEVTILASRAKVVSFSTPYYAANQGVLIRKGLARPKSIADLRKLQLCAQKDTTGLALIQTKIRPTKAPLVYSASSTAAFDAVEAGRCDALILDVPIIGAQAKKKPGAYGGVAGQIVTNEFYGAVMDKGSKFKPYLDRAIKKLKANGTISRLTQKWIPPAHPPILK